MIRTRIISTGHYLPEKVVTNVDLEKVMDTSDEWIRQRTGILQRHIVEPGVGPSDLGAKAAQRALDAANLKASDIDFLICATITPDYPFPATACVIQHELGMKNVGAMDLGAACSGFLYALKVADAFIRGGTHRRVLVIAAEVMSARLDYGNRNTAVLFGDGAGAVILEPDYTGRGILSTYTNADGSASDMLCVPAGGTKQVITPENINDVETSIVMDGRALYKRAVYAFNDATQKALEPTGLSADDIDLFIPHQANQRIIDSAVKRLGMDPDKVYLNLDRVANTSAASIPIALDEANQKGLLEEGSLLLMAAFGAGLTWGSAMVRW
jgi:3-oxoacyl-[acyl-carrier-protein] synthase III